MVKERKISQEQNARIYCVKNGHANYGYSCWGYVYCGRCGDQIGDRLGGIFPLANKFAFIECKKKNCKPCQEVIQKLKYPDSIIFARLKKQKMPDTAKAIAGINFQTPDQKKPAEKGKVRTDV